MNHLIVPGSGLGLYVVAKCSEFLEHKNLSDSWDRYADDWDDNEDVRTYAEKAFQSLLNVTSIEGLNILDFGCGTGLLTEKLAPLADQILALDSSPKMIAVLENKNLSKVQTLALELSEETIKSSELLSAKFDLIVASSVCAFIPDYQKTLSDLKSLLKPKGLLVQWDWLKTDKEADFGFDKDMIESAAVKSGLKLKEITEPFNLESSKGTMSVIMAVMQKV